MPLGLHARIIIEPASVYTDRWVHDMANALCRAKLRLEVQRTQVLRRKNR